MEDQRTPSTLGLQMDPGLWELLEERSPEDEVAVILRLRDPDQPPPGVRVVAHFGTIATVRLRRADIPATRTHPDVHSAKAPRRYMPEHLIEPVHVPRFAEPPAEIVPEVDQRRPDSARGTGRGVVVGIVDWGCDFAHPDFRKEDGTTRLLALWDQRPHASEPISNRYGYGRIHTAEAINRALAAADPYKALNYHPADSDTGRGSHGTHTLSIAAGNGRGGGPLGVAPEADLVFVELSTWGEEGMDRLGDSVALLEAVDFIVRTAESAGEPCVINLSMGRQAGEHDGLTLLEQALDALVTEAPGRACVHSTGNYFSRGIHSSGQLRPGERHTLIVHVHAVGTLPHEIDIWYSGRDRIAVELCSPDGTLRRRVELGGRASLTTAGEPMATIYNRARDPNNHDNDVDIFIYPGAPKGAWHITLIGEDVVDGRFHAWIERDASCAHCQPQFDLDKVVPTSTTGTICNGFRTIAVGAYNAHSRGRELASFSSSGPTRDGRQKPDLCAPGVFVLAARSAPREPRAGTPLLTRMSGTSMAAPHVAGCIAAMFSAAPRRLTIQETRVLLLTGTDRIEADETSSLRIGSGYLSIGAAIEAAASYGGQAVPARDDEVSEPAAVTGTALAPAMARELEESDGVREHEESDEAGASEISELPSGPEDSASVRAEATERLALSEASEPLLGIAAAVAETLETLPSNDRETAMDGRAGRTHWCRCSPGSREREASSSPDELVQFVNEAVMRGQGRLSGRLLHEVVTRAGVQWLEGAAAAGAPGRVSAIEVFDAFVGRGPEARRRHFENAFEVVAAPGQRLGAGLLHPADVVIRRGEGFAHEWIVASPERWRVTDLRAAGLVSESDTPGEYVQVIEGGALPHSLADGFARRVTDPAGLVPIDMLVLRPLTGLPEADEGVEPAEAAVCEALSRPSSGSSEAAPAAPCAPPPPVPAQCLGVGIREVVNCFDFGSAKMLPRHQPPIVNLARCILESQKTVTPITTLTLFGHTDSVGSDADNDALGQRRADAVKAEITATLNRLSGGRAPAVAITTATRGERDLLPGDRALSRRVEIFPALPFTPVSLPIQIEIVTDDDDDHVVDERAPVTTFVRFGLWNNAYDAAGNIKNARAEADNFVGADRRRFYFRVNDPTVTGSAVTVSWKTLRADRRTDDDAPASQAITLLRTKPGSKVFVSKAIMLVTDDTDANQQTHSGFAPPQHDAGLRKRGQSNHRLRRAGIEGFVQAEYRPSLGTPVTVVLPVFQRTPKDERRRVSVRVINYGSHASAAYIAGQFTHANNRWNQIGTSIDAQVTVDRPIPAGALNDAGVYAGAANNAFETAALNDLVPVTLDNTLTAVFVPLTGANAYTTVAERTTVAIGDRYFIFIDTTLDLNNETLAHELSHVLFNRFDGATDRQFYALNTNPATSFGVPLPDPRIRRRIQNLNSPDPDNDPPNDNVINWVCRTRTARFPNGGELGPAMATTGNTLMGNF